MDKGRERKEEKKEEEKQKEQHHSIESCSSPLLFPWAQLSSYPAVNKVLMTSCPHRGGRVTDTLYLYQSHQ